MRLGVVAALIFMVLGLGLLYGSYEGSSMIDSDMQHDLNNMQSAAKVVEEGDLGAGDYLTLLAAPFTYFDSFVSMAWRAYNNPLWDSGAWTLVPYFTISPFIITLFFGLIILLIGILNKTV